MSIQIGDFVQLSDDHARYDMTDGVGIRDGSLRTPRDYGRVTNVEARTKLVEVASVTRRDAEGAAITWSYGIRQLKRADQSVGRRCAWFDKIKIAGSVPALYDVTEYEVIGLREDDHLLNMIFLTLCLPDAVSIKYERDRLDNGPFKMFRSDSGDLLGPCMLLEQFLTGTSALAVHEASQLRPALVQYEAVSLRTTCRTATGSPIPPFRRFWNHTFHCLYSIPAYQSSLKFDKVDKQKHLTLDGFEFALRECLPPQHPHRDAFLQFLREVKEPEQRLQHTASLVKKGKSQEDAAAEAQSHSFAVSYDEFNQFFMFSCVVGPAPNFTGFKDIPSFPLLLDNYVYHINPQLDDDDA